MLAVQSSRVRKTEVLCCPETSARNYHYPEDHESHLLHSCSLRSCTESDMPFHLLSEIYSKIFPLADMFHLGGHLNKSPCIQVSTAQGERGGLDYKGMRITEEERLWYQ
jgi:hypothetical protein